MAKVVTHQGLKSFFGSEDHLKVSQEKSFSQMIFELLAERSPAPEELRVFELILNLSIDHGSNTPSAIKVIEAANEGKNISEAIAAGIGQINDAHGGAAEPLMRELYKVDAQGETVASIVKEYLESGKKLPGFGHRIYKDQDPRAQLILEKLKSIEGSEQFVGILKELEAELEKQTGKKLPINIDGAIAAALCSFGWESNLGKAVFIIARTPGLCGQYLNASK